MPRVSRAGYCIWMSTAKDLEARFRVPERGFCLADRDPGDRAGLQKKQAKEIRATDLKRLEELQDRLYAESAGHPALAEIAERHGVSESRVTLAWPLRRSPAMLPIPGTLSLEHLRDNLAALELELTDAEFEALR